MTTPADRLNPGLRARAVLARLPTRQPVPLRGLMDVVRTSSGPPVTLLCVCPVTPDVVLAALHVAGEMDFPLLFAATLNQVHRDGGYTGWTPETFVGFLEREIQREPLPVPVFVGLDHGGPWCRDEDHTLSVEAALASTRASLEACLDAGYTHLHIDATLDASRPDGSARAQDALDRSAALIEHAEAYRRRRNLPPVSFEVSAERESGAHLEVGPVAQFVAGLGTILTSHPVPLDPPLFTVANVGTDLHSPTFDARHARALADALEPHGTHLKGHFTDFVADLSRYPAAGVAAANVGPELASVEYGRLRLLAVMARSRGRDVAFESVIGESIEDSGRWRKWLLPGEQVDRLQDLSGARQRQIVETASRYVLSTPRVAALRARLYEVSDPGVDVLTFVQDELRRTLRRYAEAFNLKGLAARILAAS